MSFLEVVTETCILALFQFSKTANTFLSVASTFLKGRMSTKKKISLICVVLSILLAVEYFSKKSFLYWNQRPF